MCVCVCVCVFIYVFVLTCPLTRPRSNVILFGTSTSNTQIVDTTVPQKELEILEEMTDSGAGAPGT